MNNVIVNANDIFNRIYNKAIDNNLIKNGWKKG